MRSYAQQGASVPDSGDLRSRLHAGPGYGISFRAAGNFRQRIETKQDLPAQELEESLGEAFALAG